MRKLVLFCVSLLFCLLIVSFSFAAETEGDFRGIHWAFSKGTLSITGSGSVDTEGPWSSYKDKVKTLEFSGNDLSILCSFGYKNVSTIHIGKGVLRVSSFRGIKSKKVKLIVDENHFQWESTAFTNVNITDIELGEGVDSFVIEDGFVLDKSRKTLLMYYGSKKDVIIVPESVETIKKEVFVYNQAKEIRLPQNLQTIEDNVFIGCDNLKQLTVPASVTTIGSSAFGWCKKLTSLNFVTSKVSLVYQSEPDYYAEMNSLKVLVIPNCTDISEICVVNNPHLNYVIVSEGNEKLDGNNGRLYDDSDKGLIGVFLPKSLKSISTSNLPYIPSVKFYVLAGSYAHQFVEKNGYTFYLVQPITKVELSKESLELKVKKSVTLKATVFPAEAKLKQVQWMSSNENVAIVTDGKVTATGEGECDIICRGLDCGGVTAICHVKVTK